VFGWDLGEVARIAVDTVARAPERARLEVVRFVLFGAAAHRTFDAALLDVR
jgi:hypothetical protein